jgi:hypothetical protein
LLLANQPLDYDPEVPDMWRAALFEHFPGLVAALEKAVQKDAAVDLLADRLRTAGAAAGMNARPWLLENFVPALAETIGVRAVRNELGSGVNFDWQQEGFQNWDLRIGNLSGMRRLAGLNVVSYFAYFDEPADISAYEEQFEQFFRHAESWPEAAAVGRAWDEWLGPPLEAASRQLAVAAATDPITTRCSLCRSLS